jgi:hypothetical protein
LAGDVPLLAAWLLAALGIGGMLRRAFRLGDGESATALPAVVTSIALGLGTISLAVLGLGLVGWLNRLTAFTVVGLGIALAAVEALRYRSCHHPGEADVALRAWLTAPARWGWLWLAVMPLLAIVVVGALVPPGMLWTPDEPHGYDVVEYHLQIPREWYEARGIAPLRHNVFSFFPFNVEMHYLLAMHLRGGPWRGMYLAQLMHAAHVVLTALAIYGFARAAAPRRGSAVITSVIAASVPWLTLLAPIAYNEGGLLLYGTLAIGWALRAARDGSVRHFALAGVMAGFACGAKLTAVPMVLIGLPVAVGVEALLVGRAVVPRIAAGCAVFGLAGLLTFTPWLMRNAVWAGNPVFPEAVPALGRAHFTAQQVERWQRAHKPPAAQAAPSQRLHAFIDEVLGSWRFGFVLVPLAFVSVVAIRGREPGGWVLLILLAGLSSFWLALTHLQGRFFVLAIPIAALMVGRIEWGRWAPAGGVLAVAAAVAGWGFVHGQVASRLYGSRQWAQLLAYPGEKFVELHPPEIESMPIDATLTLVGEARAFWFPRPMKTLRYRTVFDVDVPAGGNVIDAWRGQPLPNEWLLIDPAELSRFSKTYFEVPPPPPDVSARPEPYVVAPTASRR